MRDMRRGASQTELELSPPQRLERAPEVIHARDLINAARSKGVDAVLPDLLTANASRPGILTLAICHDSLLARNIGKEFGCFLPWTAVVDSHTSLSLQSYQCRENGSSWRDSLSTDRRAGVDRVVTSFVEGVKTSGKMFSDNPKIHLMGVEHDNDRLTFVTRPARYSENAAISLSMGNALYELSKITAEPRAMERDERNIRAVLSLLEKLDMKVGESGVDFSLGTPNLPHTLGVSGVLLTKDGYLIQALQGNRNMTSGGDFVPAISGSADPLPGTTSGFNPAADFFREKGEEQGESPLSFWGISGVYQSLHRLGKPEVFVVGVLKDSLLEFLQRKGADTGSSTSWELKVRMATATKLGELHTGFNPSLGDDVRLSDKIGMFEASPAQAAADAMRRGELQCHIDPAGSASILAHIRSGGLENHVNQAALASALGYMKLLGRTEPK